MHYNGWLVWLLLVLHMVTDSGAIVRVTRISSVTQTHIGTDQNIRSSQKLRVTQNLSNASCLKQVAISKL